MRKNLFNTADANEISHRAVKLNDHSQLLWGSLSVTEMLHHCNIATKAILEAKSQIRKSTIKQKFLKFLFLHVIKKFPQNAKAPEKLNVKKRQLKTSSFESELQEFQSLLQKFVQHKQMIDVSHPVFGKLSTKEWGYFTYMHLDHHLRQFGV